MKSIQYRGPSDTFDASNILGKPDMVFHTPTHIGIAPDLRGNVLQVTNDHFDELMSYPGHQFIEVPEAEAKALKDAQDKARKNREGLEALRAEAETGVPGPTVEAQIASFTPPAVEFAPTAVRSAQEVKGEVQAETQALSAKASTAAKE